jgi:hypothetical protein
MNTYDDLHITPATTGCSYNFCFLEKSHPSYLWEELAGGLDAPCCIPSGSTLSSKSSKYSTLSSVIFCYSR